MVHSVQWRQVRRGAGRSKARWLIDDIALAQRFDKLLAAEDFQSWKLKVNADRTGTLTCEDGDGGVLLTRAIRYTDFPLEEITLYLINKTHLTAKENVLLQRN